MIRRIFGGLATILVAGSAFAAEAAIGPDAAACTDGLRPALLVRVAGFKVQGGALRVQVYGGKANDWLAKGRKLKRIELPVTASRMNVCVALPGEGRYAVAVRHDLDGNGKSDWSDGGGFSRNPKISLLHLKPAFGDVVVAVGNAPKPVDVVLNYRSGFKIGPVGR